MTSIAQVKRRLAERAGLEPGLLDCESFERIIRGRLRELGLDNSRAYCERLDRDASELQRLVEQVSVSETWFFRYPDSFALLLRHLNALRSTENPPARLRMLSVACSTGQEPYSMAITAAQAGWPLESVILDAVDRNEDAILAANQASYPRRALRDDAPEWALQWLHPEGDRIRVDAQIKTAVRWIVADVLQPPTFAFQDRYDVIFCRNLLIYLHPAARANLTERLSGWLSPSGLLFVGHAERIESLRPRFQFVAEPHTFALRASEPEQPTVSASEGSEHRPAARPVAVTRPVRPTLREALAPASGGRQSPDSCPASVPTLRQASALADSGDLDGALLAAEAMIEAQAPSADAFALLGSVHLAKGNLPLARKSLIKSLYLDPHREETLLQMALVYQRLGNQPQAARYRRRAAQSHHAGSSEESR